MRKEYYYIILVIFFVIGDSYGLSVDSLKAPMGDLKKEVFSWMFGVKVASVAIGSMFALARQSLMPFGVGAALTMGIHFFDKFIGDASAALI